MQPSPPGGQWPGRSAVIIVMIGLMAVGGWYSIRSSNHQPQSAKAKTSTSTSATTQPGTSAVLKLKMLITQTPVSISTSQYEDDCAIPLPGKSRIILFDPTLTSAASIHLTQDFFSAGKPNLSFDAKTFLFLGRKNRSDPIEIWEMSVEGGPSRKVTDCDGECLDVLHLSTMYTLDAEKPSDLIAFVSRKKTDSPPQLFTCKRNGSDRRQITFSPAGVSDPYLLRDGRLLISIPTQPDEDTTLTNTKNTSFYVINTDGTDLFPFAGFHESSSRRSSPVETAEGRVYYLEAKSPNDHHSQSIVSVDRKHSLRSRRVVKTVREAEHEGNFYSLTALPDKQLLVSHQPSSPESSAGIYLIETVSELRSTKIYDDEAWHEIEAQAIFAKPKPSGRSSVVNNKTDVGQLYCLNAYLSDIAEDQKTKNNSIHRVRLYASDISANPVQRVLGDIPVEADGSFYLEIPARTPLRLETLAQSGDVIRSMRNWFWVMPMERRGCIGCHEDRELTPPNRHVHALRKRPHRIGISTLPSMKQYEEGHQP